MEWKFVYSGIAWLSNNWAKVRPWVTPQALASETRTIPTNTFRVVIDTLTPPWWHMGKRGDEPATHIHARYYVTNITEEKMLVVGCKLKPEGADQTYDLRHTVRQLGEDEDIGTTVLVSVDGFIHPSITRDGESLEAQIIFVDQFGNEISGPVTTFTQN